MRISHKRGISIVEIIIAAAIIAVCVVGIVGAIQVYMKIVHQNTREAQAVLLLDETAEAIRYIRDAGDFDPNTGTTYTVFWNGTGYELTQTSVVLPYDMTRTVVFEEVERNGNDQIVSNGSVDEDTLKATITIEWPYAGETKSLESEMLIHNMYE